MEVLVMCLADPSGNPRPRRVIELCLGKGYRVSVVSYEPRTALGWHERFTIPPYSQGIVGRLGRKIRNVIVIGCRLCLRGRDVLDYVNNFKYRLMGVINQLKGRRLDMVIVEDLQLLPAAFQIRDGARIVFDAREYYPKQHDNQLLFRLLKEPERVRLCHKYLSGCDYLFTVSDGLAREYKEVFGVDMTVLRSTPRYANMPIGECDGSAIRMVHHGMASRGRKIELMIDVMETLDERFTLDFYLTGDDGYCRELRERARGNSQIRFKEPVRFDEILAMLNQYDIGLYLLSTAGFNTRHSLPNKLFEYIQARLAVVVGPSPDMGEVVKAFECGIVMKSFDKNEIALSMNSMTRDQITGLKRNSDRAARELCFEKEGRVLVDIMDRVAKERRKQGVGDEAR